MNRPPPSHTRADNASPTSVLSATYARGQAMLRRPEESVTAEAKPVRRRKVTASDMRAKQKKIDKRRARKKGKR